MSEKTIFKKNPNMVTRVIGKEVILLPIYKTSDEINCIYTLDKSASRVWELIDGKRTKANIKKKLVEEFSSTPQQVNKELETLVADLKGIKAIK